MKLAVVPGVQAPEEDVALVGDGDVHQGAEAREEGGVPAGAELVPQDGLLVRDLPVAHVHHAHLVRLVAEDPVEDLEAALDTLGVGQQQRLVRAGRRQPRGLVQLQEHELGRDGARLHHN